LDHASCMEAADGGCCKQKLKRSFVDHVLCKMLEIIHALPRCPCVRRTQWLTQVADACQSTVR
jgi:hypothetical protein